MARVQLLSLLVVFLLAASAQAQWVSGIATFSGEDVKASSVGSGACGYGTLTAAQFPGLNLAGVSLSKSILGKEALKGCGACIELKCTDKEACSSTSPVTVLVHDNCDKCDTNQINLHIAPFAKLANPDVGRVKIEYRQVPCSFGGGVIVGVDTFRATAGGYVRLAFKKVNGAPLVGAEIAKAGSDAFVPMKNAFGAAFEASRLPALPWDIKLTNADGKSIVLSGAVETEKTGDISTSKNF